jgi:hypothetical protein
MKDSIVAQQVAQTFLTRQEIKGMFDPDLLRRAILKFLQGGSDGEDRAECVRLALGRANRRMDLSDIIAEAQKILDWPPMVPVPAKKKAGKKKAGKKKGPFKR